MRMREIRSGHRTRYRSALINRSGLSVRHHRIAQVIFPRQGAGAAFWSGTAKWLDPP